MKTEAFLQKISSRKKVSAKTSFHFTRNVSYFIFLRALDAYIVDIMEKKLHVHKILKKKLRRKHQSRCKYEHCRLKKWFTRKNTREYTRVVLRILRALFCPKHKRLFFFFPPMPTKWDITKKSQLPKYIFSSVAFLGVAFNWTRLVGLRPSLPTSSPGHSSCNFLAMTFWE